MIPGRAIKVRVGCNTHTHTIVLDIFSHSLSFGWIIVIFGRQCPTSVRKFITNPAAVHSSLMSAALWIIKKTRFDKSLIPKSPRYSEIPISQLLICSHVGVFYTCCLHPLVRLSCSFLWCLQQIIIDHPHSIEKVFDPFEVSLKTHWKRPSTLYLWNHRQKSVLCSTTHS